MPTKPVNFNLPDRLIDELSHYCIDSGMKTSEFFRVAVAEYAHNLQKLADAVASRVLTSLSTGSDSQLRRVTHRVEVEDVAILRLIARNADLAFEGLVRVIIEDKLMHVRHRSVRMI